MRRPTVALVLVLDLLVTAAGCARTRGAAVNDRNAQAQRTSALAIDSALAALAGTPLWPGFAPLEIPVAIFDGERTYLFRHPAPPAGYSAVAGRTDVVVREGRDPAVTANSSAPLGGFPTATAIPDMRQSPRELAALTVHELFHVFQRARHPSWQGNEADLFTYPVEDSTALALRREETDALARTLAAGAADSVRCWARAFVDARDRRFVEVGPTAAAYERGTELNEGLAQYVERRAAGESPRLDAVDAPATRVRQRAYDVGAAVAASLDRVRPDWRDVLERAPRAATLPLDSLLGQAVSGGSAGACAATGAERARWASQAGEDVHALVLERARSRDEYLGRAGWRLIVDATGSPLFPAGFDPLNVARLSAAEILHTRFLKLQGPLGTIEVLGRAALTEGTGKHPLFAGVRRVTITGLQAPPSMTDSAGVLAVDAPGLTIRLRSVKADVSGQTVRLVPR